MGNFIFDYICKCNTTVMKERILEFLRAENKTSAQLADEIGVQASGISHILSGRNNPSLDFVLKMLEKYKFLSTDWLLFGKGPMYTDSNIQSLFGDQKIKDDSDSGRDPVIEFNAPAPPDNVKISAGNISMPVAATDRGKEVIKRIVMFYENGTFEEYEKK
jgi:transcriptional regulator with XRE-family HTH domain